MKKNLNFSLKFISAAMISLSTLCNDAVTTNVNLEGKELIGTCCNRACPLSLLPSQVGWQQFINKADMDQNYGATYAALGYKRSFNNKCCPKTDSFILDLGGFVGFDSFAPGLYLKLRAPLVNQRCCYNNVKQTKTFLAGIKAALGYNFLLDEDYFLGASLLVTAPTNRNSCYLNGKYWEAGLGVAGSYKLWKNEDEDKHLAVYLDTKFTGLREKCASQTLVYGKEDAITEEDKKERTYSCYPVKINHIKSDLSLMLEYVHRNWAFDLGYNLLVDSMKCNNYCGNVCTVYCKDCTDKTTCKTISSDADNCKTTGCNTACCDSNRCNRLNNKLFANVSYAWNDSCETVVPFFGFGGEVEKQRRCDTYNAAIWLKGGISF